MEALAYSSKLEFQAQGYTAALDATPISMAGIAPTEMLSWEQFMNSGSILTE
jgi:hypothetical protein